MDVTRGDWLDGWGVKRSKSTAPAPGVLCEALLEMNKMDERRVKQSLYSLCVLCCARPSYPTILPFQSQSPRALVVLLGLPILYSSSLRSCGAAGAEPGHRQEAL